MEHKPSRRRFLGRSIAIVPAAALGASACTEKPVTSSDAAAVPSGDSTAASPYQPAFFQPLEWAFVQAAVARLIPFDDVGPGALDAGVPEFIDRQMDAVSGHAANWYTQGPFVDSPPEFGYQGQLVPRAVYRVGIAAADAHCKSSFDGKTFSRLGAVEQDKVLKGMESVEIKFEMVSSKTFFSFMLQNTKEGYLSDPIHGGNKKAASWAMIGFPGARADFADWVGRPGERYPLPPVSIGGAQR